MYSHLFFFLFFFVLFLSFFSFFLFFFVGRYIYVSITVDSGVCVERIVVYLQTFRIFLTPRESFKTSRFVLHCQQPAASDLEGGEGGWWDRRPSTLSTGFPSDLLTDPSGQ